MNPSVSKAINDARSFFDIKEFPGNLFLLFQSEEYIDKYNLILFKEDIGKLSGFIGYGPDDTAIICINYKRPIGHQNFTLAHELGHMFLHRGINISDDTESIFSSQKIEKEANDFAAELLYPERNFIEDYRYIIKNKLLFNQDYKTLGEYIDKICRKYCLSFELVLRKILFQAKMHKRFKEIKKKIDIAIGGKISECFDKDFYVANEDLPQYQSLKLPYDIMEKKLNKLVGEKKIGIATAESIKLRNGIEIK